MKMPVYYENVASMSPDGTCTQVSIGVLETGLEGEMAINMVMTAL